MESRHVTDLERVCCSKRGWGWGGGDLCVQGEGKNSPCDKDRKNEPHILHQNSGCDTKRARLQQSGEERIVPACRKPQPGMRRPCVGLPCLCWVCVCTSFCVCVCVDTMHFPTRCCPYLRERDLSDPFLHFIPRIVQMAMCVRAPTRVDVQACVPFVYLSIVIAGMELFYCVCVET